jgi:hypothetical protein
MTMAEKLSLAERRRMIRNELLAQRELIVEQLHPASNVNSVYPRSMTMRFLTEHSTLAGGVFTGAATLLVGARYFKSITTALTMFKVVRSVVTSK